MVTPLSDVAGLAALVEPVRRDLFDFVTRSRTAVSRDEAAEALGIAAHTAKFHLDRLVEEDLLEVEYRRVNGRTGPGAGRPAKLYRRTERELTVSLPERHYDLLSRILARAVAASVATDEPVSATVARVARDEGKTWGAAFEDGASKELDRLGAALTAGGYEPWVEDDTMFLRNCPFHRIAQDEIELVCGLNLEFISGVATGADCPAIAVRLDPGEDRCCVSASPV